MRLLKIVMLAAALNACASPPPDTVESLAADPARLHELLRVCREGWSDVGEETCVMANAAWRKRFMGDGRVTSKAID